MISGSSVFQLNKHFIETPLTLNDLTESVRKNLDNKFSITLRAGGTSLGGQAIGEGVIQDDLNAFVAQELCFSLDTSNRAIIGNNQPITLERFIQAIEQTTGKKTIRNQLPMQLGDVPRAYADVVS